MCVMKDSISAMCRAAFLILCLVGASLQVTISEFAVPRSIKTGDSAELQCQYQLGAGETLSGLFYVKWWWTPLGAAAEARLPIYQRMLGQPPWRKHFNNIEIKDNDTLLLKDLLPKHSGTYECEVSENFEARKHQTMVVYTAGSGPAMNISEVADGPDEDKDDDVQVSCRASDVAPRPDLVLTLNGQEIPDGEEEVTQLPEGLFDIAANATLSKADVRGGTIRCELFYNDSNVTHEAFYVDHTYEELDAGAVSTLAPPPEEPAVTMDSTTDAPGNAGVAWSLSRGLLAALLAALLAGAADLFM